MANFLFRHGSAEGLTHAFFSETISESSCLLEERMDEAIRKLKSTTFFGRRLTRRQIADVQCTVRDFPKLSRYLGHTICEHLNLHTPSGGNRVRTAQRLLERLEELGILTLPAKDESKQRGAQKALVWTARSAPRAVIREALARLAPLALRVITETDEVAEWNELLDRHHYLGYRRPFGLHLRYAIVDGHGRWLGCLLFAYAAGRCCAATSSSAGTRRLGRSVWTRSSATAAS